MSKQITLLRSVAVAAISASLSLAGISVAQANPRAHTTMNPKKHVARVHRPISAGIRTFPENLPRRTECDGLHLAV